MSAPERNQQRGWAYWLGRALIWLASAAVGLVVGAILVALSQAELPGLVAVALLGLLGLFLAIASASWSLAARDAVAGFGIGNVVGAGCIFAMLNSLPSC